MSRPLTFFNLFEIIQHQLNNICAADYSEAAVEWEEWTI